MAEDTVQNKTAQTRPPVVVVLGHVDHGKTKLLDTIRKTSVAEHESGGITQHIGAYQVEVPQGPKSSEASREGGLPKRAITFLDTPGHEAFSAIRSRGVKVADVAILVMAADEGVKPQTKEAIGIIKESEIPFIVAINKIDKEGANPQKVKQDLAAENILVEDWGGKIPVVEISAREGRNISELLDMILLVADLEELTAETGTPAQGVIIESYLDKRRGYVATALVQQGILRVGTWITVGRTVGKVKSMEDFLGKSLDQAVPSQPVSITGWSEAPDIGKPFFTAVSKDKVQEIADGNINIAPLLLFLQEQAPLPEPGRDKKKLNVVFKSDVSSSLEAIEAALKSIPSDEVCYEVLEYGIGNITEADVRIAAGAQAMIFGFRVRIEESAKKVAEKEGVAILTFDIIYELIAAVREALGGLLAPEIIRNVIGKLRVLAVFKKDARSIIAGGKVTSGAIRRGAMADVLRGDTLIATGKIGQLQQNKEDVPEVKEGLEAGIRFDIARIIEGTTLEIRDGDIVEVYEEQKSKRTL